MLNPVIPNSSDSSNGDDPNVINTAICNEDATGYYDQDGKGYCNTEVLENVTDTGDAIVPNVEEILGKVSFDDELFSFIFIDDKFHGIPNTFLSIFLAFIGLWFVLNLYFYIRPLFMDISRLLNPLPGAG